MASENIERPVPGHGQRINDALELENMMRKDLVSNIGTRLLHR